MNTWASLRWKFLAVVILVWQLNSDRTSERHSLEATSIEYMSTQDRMSDDRVSKPPIEMSAFDVRPRRKEGERQVDLIHGAWK